MAFRITDGVDSVQKISAIPLAAATGTRAAARYDGAATSGTHTSFVAAVYCEEDTTNGNQVTIWELYNGATCTMAVRLQYSAGNWILSSHLAGSSSTINWTLPIDPRGKWLMISLCHINRTSAVSDRLCAAVYDFSTGLTHTTAAGVFTGASATAPTHAAIGNNVMFGTGNRNMRGIVIPAIRTDAIWDGTSPIDSIPTVAISALAAGGITGHISYNSFSGILWAANYVAANRTGGYDSRDGQTLTTSNMYGLDANHGTFPTYGQIALGCAVTGTITAVDPYDYGGIGYPPPTDTTVGSDSLPATALTLAASGRRGRKTTKLANWINNGTGSGQLRVGFFGNSRAVYPYGYALRLSDGTYPGRTLPTNFNDMGIIGQAGLWNNGRIIGMFVPPPTCNWTGTNQLEGAYGVDCSGGLLRTRDSVGTVVNPSTVLTAMTSTTLGTRMTLAARAANTPPSSGVGVANAYGAGNSVRLAAGCTYRVMVRPEAGLPVTDPLTVRLHLINYPSSSPIDAAKKVVAAGQNSAEDSSSAIAFPGLGSESAAAPPTAKSITAVDAASLTNQVTHASYGSVTVDDADLGFSALHALEAGDMIQLQDSAGTTNVYNEAWIVREVTGQGTDTCTIYYEWLPRQAPIIGDKVTFIKHDAILNTVEATFTANEVTAGKWRGIEITADAAGDGILIYAVEFINPARDGVHVSTIGRTGCGAWIQAARWPRITDGDGQSLTKRIFQAMDLDVLVITTADQGTASGNYVASFNTLIDYVTADSPTTEVVMYSTGPEWQGESTFSKVDHGDKYDWAAAMQYSAGQKNVPHTAFLFGRSISAFGRITTGDDTTEGPVHPGTVLDVSFLGAQLAGLTAEATSLGHGFGGRTRSALRYRG